ncbi:MAG: NRAMP family divalent metal transporter [Chitinophagaceae bacterium]
MQANKTSSAILGAAFLMATSAIGPGFITQTTVFTQQLLTSFGFVILVSIALDIATQLNTWRIIAIAEKRAQDIANDLLPGMGYFLALLIVLGGLAFNIGNVGGAGLGINILFPIDKNPDYPIYGASISAGIALAIFWVEETAGAMDKFSKFLGVVMISLTLYVALKTDPPVFNAIKHSFFPEKISLTAIITLVGGTVGGYISFAGAHRLLDAGIKGPAHLQQVTRASITGILLASVMRIFLFIAALGVITGGGVLDLINPAASVFQIAGGTLGYKIFGIVLWCAAITSVVGSAYTSVSFLRTFHPWFEKNQRWIISFFIICSTLIFAFIGKPKKILVFVGALNGLILPISLGLMLLAVGRYKIMGTYKHPFWMSLIGWIVVLVMSWMGLKIIVTDLPKLLN